MNPRELNSAIADALPYGATFFVQATRKDEVDVVVMGDGKPYPATFRIVGAGQVSRKNPRKKKETLTAKEKAAIAKVSAQIAADIEEDYATGRRKIVFQDYTFDIKTGKMVRKNPKKRIVTKRKPHVRSRGVKVYMGPGIFDLILHGHSSQWDPIYALRSKGTDDGYLSLTPTEYALLKRRAKEASKSSDESWSDTGYSALEELRDVKRNPVRKTHVKRAKKQAKRAKTARTATSKAYHRGARDAHLGRKKANPLSDLNPHAKKYTFETFSEKYWGPGWRAKVAPSIAKEFYQDFRWAHNGSLTSYIKATSQRLE